MGEWAANGWSKQKCPKHPKSKQKHVALESGLQDVCDQRSFKEKKAHLAQVNLMTVTTSSPLPSDASGKRERTGNREQTNREREREMDRERKREGGGGGGARGGERGGEREGGERTEERRGGKECRSRWAPSH